MRLAGVGAVLVLAAGSTATAAGPSSRQHGQVERLRVQAQLLDTRTHRALLDLYALDSRLGATQQRLASLEALAARLRARQAELAQELAAVRQTLVVSRSELGRHLRTLYEQGNVDPIAVVLGSQSLSEAITKLDDLSRVADQSRQVVAVTSAAQLRLVRVRVALAAQGRRLGASLVAAQATQRQLASARGDRLAFLGSLRAQERLKAAQIRGLLATAQHVEAKTQQIQSKAAADAPAGGGRSTPGQTTPAAPVRPPAVPPAAAGGRTLVVSATGYSLPGRTATGMPVGWGVVAVDPSVIPLGTKLSIPGYGEAVAADVGSGVRGAMIDLWFPTLAQALAWGRRTVTITLH